VPTSSPSFGIKDGIVETCSKSRLRWHDPLRCLRGGNMNIEYREGITHRKNNAMAIDVTVIETSLQ
jgi:hypothetical protein